MDVVFFSLWNCLRIMSLLQKKEISQMFFFFCYSDYLLKQCGDLRPSFAEALNLKERCSLHRHMLGGGAAVKLSVSVIPEPWGLCVLLIHGNQTKLQLEPFHFSHKNGSVQHVVQKLLYPSRPRFFAWSSRYWWQNIYSQSAFSRHLTSLGLFIHFFFAR